MRTVVIIQARMSSTRLPGKVMLPLDGKPVLERLLHRLNKSVRADDIVVATTDKKQDKIIARAAKKQDASVYRGDESDVLGRIYSAAKQHDADLIVRVCADSPFVCGNLVDTAVQTLQSGNYDYVSNKIERSFPIGFDVEAFTSESFDTVDRKSNNSHEREHVTIYYRENSHEFSRRNISSTNFFDEVRYQDRTDLRLTLDEPDDYKLINSVYNILEQDDETSLGDVIRTVDENDLSKINCEVQQKSMYDSEKGE